MIRHLASFVFVVISCVSLVGLVRPTAINASVLVGQSDLIRDPSVAAQKLYGAWQAKDRRGAADFATNDAVSKLLGMAPQPLTFVRCQRTGVGEFECIYRQAKTAFEAWFKVLGGASAGYHVESVSFSTD